MNKATKIGADILKFAVAAAIAQVVVTPILRKFLNKTPAA